MSPLPSLPDPGTCFELSPDAVASLAPLIEAGSCQLIDCREADEWDINRLPGARLVPVSRFAQLAPALIDDGRPVIVYCHHGMRSLQAITWLRSRGLESAWSMAGGINAWSNTVDSSVPTY